MRGTNPLKMGSMGVMSEREKAALEAEIESLMDDAHSRNLIPVLVSMPKKVCCRCCGEDSKEIGYGVSLFACQVPDTDKVAWCVAMLCSPCAEDPEATLEVMIQKLISLFMLENPGNDCPHIRHNPINN